MTDRHRTRGSFPWERRLLDYARFCADSALGTDFYPALIKMLRADFPYVLAMISYAENGSIRAAHFANVLPSLQREYAQYFHHVNPFRRAVQEHHLEHAVAAFDRYVPREELLKTEYYNDFMRHASADYLAAISVRTGSIARTSISIYRSERDGGSFEGDELRRLEQLWPFLRTAMTFREMWERHGANLPVLTLDRAAPLNEAGEQHLRQRRVPREAAVLRTPSCDRPALVLVPPPTVHAILADRCGLSVREAEVAIAMREGLSYKEAADRLGISVHTVASHLKACRRKTSARSMTQLVRLISAAIAD